MTDQKKGLRTCCMAGALLCAGFYSSSAVALDPFYHANPATTTELSLSDNLDEGATPTLLDVDQEESPAFFFKHGFTAYKSGQTSEAVRALRSAADMGHTGANWKLGRMYADGDGVDQDSYKAYLYFQKIIQGHIAQGSEDEAYLADALLCMAHYLRFGIKDSPVKADPVRARAFFMRAATTFGDPEAQYELGTMLLNGEGGEQNVVQAGRWFRLSAKKGNVAAQAMLGHLLYQTGHTVRGLALMTAAFERADKQDRSWIRYMQEEAFALTPEDERRVAITLANDMLKNNTQ